MTESELPSERDRPGETQGRQPWRLPVDMPRPGTSRESRVLEIRKTTEGAPGVGTVYESTVKDAGVKTHRTFELTEFAAPTKIRWAERSKNAVTAPQGGYDLEPAAEGQTRVSVHNVLEGHGFGKLIAGFALRSAQKGADDFARSIKAAVEAEVPPPAG